MNDKGKYDWEEIVGELQKEITQLKSGKTHTMLMVEIENQHKEIAQLKAQKQKDDDFIHNRDQLIHSWEKRWAALKEKLADKWDIVRFKQYYINCATVKDALEHEQ